MVMNTSITFTIFEVSPITVMAVIWGLLLLLDVIIGLPCLPVMCVCACVCVCARVCVCMAGVGVSLGDN